MSTPPAHPANRPPRVPPLRAFTPEERDRIHAAIEALLTRVREAFERMSAAVREAAETLAGAFSTLHDRRWELVALEPRRSAHPRPAWATPYGPPPRRRRS